MVYYLREEINKTILWDIQSYKKKKMENQYCKITLKPNQMMFSCAWDLNDSAEYMNEWKQTCKDIWWRFVVILTKHWTGILVQIFFQFVCSLSIFRDGIKCIFECIQDEQLHNANISHQETWTHTKNHTYTHKNTHTCPGNCPWSIWYFLNSSLFIILLAVWLS